MDLKNFASAISQICEEKGISREKVIESIETALAAAYKKDYGEKGQMVKAKLSPETGEAKFWQVKTAVDGSMIYSEEELEALKEKKVSLAGEGLEKKTEEEGGGEEIRKVRFNQERHIMMEDALKINPKIKAGEDMEFALVQKKDYGRIAAQTAKQVILQKIREAERETIFGEYKSKEGQIVSGVVQRIEGDNIFIDIGKTLAVLPREEQVYGEFYKPGQRLKFYILSVDDNPRGPAVILSRAYPKLISRLFELEVPEISAGQVVVRSIAREPGARSKIAVESTEQGIDPIGSAVGQRGTRVMAVISELGGEKIDIIEYSEKPEEFIANALSPAKVVDVKLLEKNKALCLVPDDQLSLAIGKDGQNVRLAAKLTGWKINVKSVNEEEAEKGKEKSVEDGDSAPLSDDHTENHTKEKPEEKKIEIKEEKPKKEKKVKKEKPKKNKEKKEAKKESKKESKNNN
ncbi:MAG: transcription termination factor NusA [Candidatus Nealsonbacteria bacterium RIFCSPHIGHO2_01_FULL_38_55]|uniref:Transcription termination/antitermination protein NusA n=1 Tax=Candidatus Nealsonbacteria bacterium RIFCSPHIGHO2_01_FULL_38_55 TaxID=1801664 RepID=A0A1G2E2E1_9BACT|nr:MAG: transcription termination factor NusA [Candidatus Nealsonbacteria bacterium RIFCSPHIGHO2_01_FULL_38_55]